MKKNLLITLADKNHINQAKQLFSSIYFNAGWKGDYMLLAYEIPEKDLKWFEDKGILVRRFKSQDLSELEGKVHFTKFYIFTPYFKKWVNIIYLDTDIIVRGSLDELTKIKGFAAIRDFPQALKNQFITFKEISQRNKPIFYELKKNYNQNENAFNSGVIAFSTEIIKENNFTKLKKISKRYPEIRRTFDQHVLNLFFYKKWKELPIVYNSNPYLSIMPFFITKNITRTPAIVLHFFGKPKPWNPKNPFYKEWGYNLNRAESIEDFNKPIASKRSWTSEEVQRHSRGLEKKLIAYSSLHKIDNIIGKLGIFLKNNYPKIHSLLKSIFLRYNS